MLRESESGEGKVSFFMSIAEPEVQKLSDLANPYRQKLLEKLEVFARAAYTSNDSEKLTTAKASARSYIVDTILVYDKYDPDDSICQGLIALIDNSDVLVR